MVKMTTQIITNKSQIIKTPQPDIYIIDAIEKTARAIIASLKQKNTKAEIAIKGRDNLFNRRAIETLKIDYLISPETETPKSPRKDTLKQRDSGLNHVIAKTAAKNKIQIIIDYQDINNIKNPKQKALRLARIIQNIKICRKAKCKIKIWDTKNQEDKFTLQSFGQSLGMSSQQISH